MTDTTPTPEPEDESLRQRLEELGDNGDDRPDVNPTPDPDEEEHVHGDRIPDKDDEGNPDAPGVGEPEPDAV